MDIGTRHLKSSGNKKAAMKRNFKPRRMNRNPRRTTMPSAYTSSASAYAKFNKVNSSIMFQEIFQIDCSNGAFLIPFSPTKWTGTRTKSLLQTYGSFRPRRIQMSFQPSVATSVSGVVAVGTVFNGNRIDLTADANTNIANICSLANGVMSQIYKPTSIPVRLGTALSRNSYPTTLVDEDDIPFWIVTQSSVASPGFIILSGIMSVHNPMNIIESSVGGSFVGSISRPTETEENTILTSTTIIPGLTVGDSVKLVASTELGSTTGKVLYHALEPVVATVKEVTATAVKFVVNNALAAATAKWFPIGLYSAANF